MIITGECFCGEISYSLAGELRDARSCHCSRCRKAFSSQASAYALVNPLEFNWTSGENLLTSYCGKHGFVVHGVTLGCINGDPAVEIGRHIFVGSKASWEILPLGVPVFEEGVSK